MNAQDDNTFHPGPMFSESRQGATLQIPPPFDFQGVNCRVFPLRANMSRLVHYVNQFVNAGVPDEIVFFRPAMPIVFLQIIYYGKMAVETQNFGWFSQHEFVFSVPVERYRMVNGKPQFDSWGLINPFIFVDKESSEIIGREVYGWPKVHGWVDADVNRWMENPRADRRMAALNTMVYSSVYEGREMHGRSLIEVFEKAPATWSQVPPSPQSAFNPFNAVPNAANNFWELLQTSWQNVANLATGTAMTWMDNFPVKGFQPLGNTRQDFRKIAEMIPMLLPINTKNSYSLITLKQFRDATDPRFACYQALISSQMYLNRFNAGGMLGDERLALMDSTGGFYLKIHEFPSQPIVQSLGLEPTSTEIGEDGVPVSTFEPILPFWMDVDISYDKGDIICSQTRWSKWEKGNEPKHERHGDKPKKSASLQKPLSLHDLQDSHLYNTSRGEAAEEMVGPFHFPNATMRVLPLLADRDVLQKFVEESVNGAKQEFEVFGDKVYMIVTNYDEMASDSNNIGRWAHREVRFMVPVRWYDCSKGERKLVSFAMVSPFIFCDRDTAMNTMREVYGEPAFKASIECPHGPWLDVDGPNVGSHVLDLTTDVLPALYTGSKMERRRVISVRYGDVLGQFEHANWNKLTSEWGPELVKDLESKQKRGEDNPDDLKRGKALALELLANGLPFNQISKKQFRDAFNNEHACYQALVNTETTIDHVWDLQEIEEQMHVCIADYPTQPLVRLLGLKAKWVDTKDQPRRAYLQPLRPFWMKVSMTTGVAENIAERAGSKTWRRGKGWPKRAYFNQSDHCGVGQGLAEEIDAVTESTRKPLTLDEKRKRLDREEKGQEAAVDSVPDAADFPEGEIWKHFLDKRGRNHYLKLALESWQKNADTEDYLTRKEVSEMLSDDTRVDPQMILDSILSYEWAHWGNPRFYRRNIMEEDITQLPEFCIRRDSVGASKKDLFPRNQSMEVGTGGWFPKIEE